MFASGVEYVARYSLSSRVLAEIIHLPRREVLVVVRTRGVGTLNLLGFDTAMDDRLGYSDINLTFSRPESIIATLADGTMDAMDLTPERTDPIFRAAEIWIELAEFDA